MVDTKVWFASMWNGSGQFWPETWASTWRPFQWFKVGRHPINMLVPFGPGMEYWRRRLSNDPSSRYWLEHCFISRVKTLVPTFVGWTQQRRTCIITLLKALSTTCVVVLVFIGWSRQPGWKSSSRSSLARCGNDNVRTLFLLEGVAAEEVDLVLGAYFIYCNASVMAALFCTPSVCFYKTFQTACFVLFWTVSECLKRLIKINRSST